MNSEASNFKQVTVTKVRGLNPRSRAVGFRFVSKVDQDEFSFAPGSFVMVGVPGFGEAPLTITTSPSELPEFEVAVRTTGNATMALNRLKVGDKAYIRGPLGNAVDLSSIYGRQLVLVAGGIGLAPLRSIIHTVRDDHKLVSKLGIVYGAKSPEDLIFKDELSSWPEFAKVNVIVDKSDSDWSGDVGKITDVIKKQSYDKNASFIVCGPEVMYRPISKILETKGIKPENIHLMLERRVHCGIGKCQHCTCGNKYVCTDGPTFRLSELKDNWEALK